MPSRSSDFVAFDLETTGLDAVRDEIIEIAAVRFVEARPPSATTALCVPSARTRVHQAAHWHYRRRSGPRAAPARSPAWAGRFLGESLVVGHNVGFDIAFHDESRIRCSLTPRFYRTVDTLALARIYEPFTDNHRLETLTTAHGIAIERAHRAIHDAEATGRLLIALATHISEDVSLDVNMRVLELVRTAGDETDLPLLLEEITDHQRRYALLKKQPARHAFAPANAVEHDVPSGKQYTMEQIFGQLFASAFPGYEYRPGQVQMATAVEQALHAGECLTVEAGTGVGKSLAYLAPAIQFAERNHTRVVVSTNTKNLQEQLFHKDLPAFRDAVDIPFLAVLLKGRENYLCRRSGTSCSPTSSG
jgi:DNA polymerase III epsilon subunit-like protein